MSTQLSIADKLQLEKKQVFNTQLEKAQKDFIQIYGKEGQTVFLREQRFAMQAVGKNPEILNCTPVSIFMAVSNVAMSGLSLDPIKQLAHLIPRKGVCTLVVDYKGMLELLYQDSGIMMSSGAVYEGDKGWDDFKEGVGGYVNAKRTMNKDDSAKLMYCYSVATFPDGRTHCQIMDAKGIGLRKDKAQTKKVWDEWNESMSIKTVVREHYKFLPKSAKLDKVMELIDNEIGRQPLESLSTEDLLDDIPTVEVEKPLPEGTVTVVAPEKEAKQQAKLDPTAL